MNRAYAGESICWRIEMDTTASTAIWLAQNMPSTFSERHMVVPFQKYIENKPFEEVCV